jgi:choline-glycine betaine transporter
MAVACLLVNHALGTGLAGVLYSVDLVITPGDVQGPLGDTTGLAGWLLGLAAAIGFLALTAITVLAALGLIRGSRAWWAVCLALPAVMAVLSYWDGVTIGTHINKVHTYYIPVLIVVFLLWPSTLRHIAPRPAMPSEVAAEGNPQGQNPRVGRA